MIGGERDVFIMLLSALLAGAVFGYIVQNTSAAIRHDKAWSSFPPWKKRALSLTGSISALAAGLFVIDTAPATLGESIIWRVWLWQTLAAWAGAQALEFLWDRTGKGGG